MTLSWGLLLTTCALLSPPGAESDPSARAQATLQRVVKLPPEQQQIWLRLVEQRYGWAVLLTMKPDDAQRERERVAAVLHQKAVAWNDMVTLLRQLDQREKAAISRMVRLYRTTVYENFHKREKEFVDRQEAWFRIWSAWEQVGSPPEQQDRLMDWLAEAIKASSKDSLGPLPADPKFGDVELVPEALVKQWTVRHGKPGVAQTPPAHGAEEALPGPELPLREVLSLRIPDPPWHVGRLKLPGEGVVARRENVLSLPALAVAPPLCVPQLRNRPAAAIVDPIELTSLPAPPHRDSVVAVDCKAAIGSEGSLASAAIRDNDVAKPQALAGKRPSAELPPRPVDLPSEPTIAGEAPTAVLPAQVVPRPGVPVEPEIAESQLFHRNVMAMLSGDLPRSSAAVPENPLPYQVQRKPVAPDIAPPPSPDAPAQNDQHAHVNIEELRTRIEGINLSLRALDGELSEKREFSADQLDSLLNRLDILMLRQKDLTLFRDLITPQEQAKVGQIDSSRSAVATMGTQIAALRTRVRENDSLSAADRAAALKQLDDLSDRLATLTAEK